MKRTVPMLAAAALALNVDGAHAETAQFVSGNYLYEQCSSDQSSYVAQAYCIAYILGVTDAGGGWQEATGRRLYCLSPQMTAGQIKDVGVAYLREHPESRHYAAAGLVTLTLRQAFPCASPPAQSPPK